MKDYIYFVSDTRPSVVLLHKFARMVPDSAPFSLVLQQCLHLIGKFHWIVCDIKMITVCSVDPSYTD